MDRDGVLDYALSRYGTEPDFPWKKWPEYAVLRHRLNRKWYGLVMTVPRSVLGLDDVTGAAQIGGGLPAGATVDIINVKCEPGIVYLSKDTPGVLPAYHMNKENWVSVLLDGTLPDDRVTDLLDASWRLTR